MVRSLGILSTKKELDIDVVTYPEDGIPGYFLDVVSWVGYMMVEHYIATELCNTLFSVSYGGLLTEVQPAYGVCARHAQTVFHTGSSRD